MRTTIVAAGLCASLGGCTSTHETLAASCSEYIGEPISKRIAALGPPKAVYRINATQIGYVFESRETSLVGGEPFYTVNYMTGADKHHMPVRRVTTICKAHFIVSAPSDATPMTQRIIVDVVR
jgi:hypothetical protein